MLHSSWGSKSWFPSWISVSYYFFVHFLSLSMVNMLSMMTKKIQWQMNVSKILISKSSQCVSFAIIGLINQTVNSKIYIFNFYFPAFHMQQKTQKIIEIIKVCLIYFSARTMEQLVKLVRMQHHMWPRYPETHPGL